MNLEKFGWHATFQDAYASFNNKNLIPARVISEDRGSYILIAEAGEIRGKISGAFRYSCKKRIDFPVVGDWVTIHTTSVNAGLAIIHGVLPRNSIITRKTAGANIEAQALASNVDYIFIISGLDKNYNLRRIERYLTLAWNSGVQPVIILNKVDLIKDAVVLSKITAELDSIAIGVPVLFISSLYNQKLAELNKYFTDNKTVVLLGSSGSGKSTLTNQLLGMNLQKTTSIRHTDSRGRHTTTRRQLFLLPSGGMLIDTPGIRELQLWLDEGDVDTSFVDIYTLADNCRYHDCTHTHEAGCAVQEAVSQNLLDIGRLKNYLKMRREAKYLEQRLRETSWDSRLEKRKFGKVLRDARKRRRSRNPIN